MKKAMLFTFGIGDTFCSEKSLRVAKRGPAMAQQVYDLISSNKYNFFGVVRVNDPLDTFKEVNFKKYFPDTKVIDVKLCSGSVFDNNNQVSIPGIGDNPDVVLDGSHLAHVIRAEEYDIYIAGIDINGVFIRFMKELEKSGYTATIFSDIIKPFNKSTIEVIKSSKAKFGKS
jgi:hypothetical protein